MSGKTVKPAAAAADLFGAALPAPAARPAPKAPPPPPALPVRPMPWQRRLERSPAAAMVEITASTGHHGIVLERLVEADGTEAWLYAAGTIEDRGTGQSPVGRSVFCTPAQALEIHVRRPLVGVGQDGAISMRLRFAEVGEPAEETPRRLAALRPPSPAGKAA